MTITVENSKGQRLALTETNGYAITDVQGLSPAPSNVNITGIAGGNGSMYNSAMIPQRNIVLTVYILPSIETHRNALYAFLSPGSMITLHISNNGRTGHISGIVESFDGTFFTAAENFSISILCPDPFFTGASHTEALVSGDNELTCSGDYITGFTAELTASTSADISISDGTNTLIVADITAGDVISVCTMHGSVSIKKGSTSLINSITIDKSFPQMRPGTFDMTLTNCTGLLAYSDRYGGM